MARKSQTAIIDPQPQADEYTFRQLSDAALRCAMVTENLGAAITTDCGDLQSARDNARLLAEALGDWLHVLRDFEGVLSVIYPDPATEYHVAGGSWRTAHEAAFRLAHEAIDVIWRMCGTVKQTPLLWCNPLRAEIWKTGRNGECKVVKQVAFDADELLADDCVDEALPSLQRYFAAREFDSLKLSKRLEAERAAVCDKLKANAAADGNGKNGTHSSIVSR